MLTHPTIDKLHQLRCPAMADALAEQLHSPHCDALSFEERLGLLADRELTLRDDRRMSSRLRRAKLRHPNACIKDIDYRHPRRLDKALIHSLASGRWLRGHLNVNVFIDSREILCISVICANRSAESGSRDARVPRKDRTQDQADPWFRRCRIGADADRPASG